MKADTVTIDNILRYRPIQESSSEHSEGCAVKPLKFKVNIPKFCVK